MTMWQDAINLKNFVYQPGDLIPLSYLAWLADGDQKRSEMIATYRRYYEGDHPTQLTDRMREFLEINPDIKFDINFIPIAVDVMSERFTVVGFSAGSQGGRFENEADKDNPFVMWWNANRMDGLQKSVHTSMIRDGDGYVLVDFDEERGIPRLSHEMAWDGQQGITVHYSNERAGLISHAVKRWPVDRGMGAGKYQRANVYYPDRIEKYITDPKSGQWREYKEKELSPWPLPWEHFTGQPMGISVIHFPFNRGGYDFGKSRVHDLIPIQDALNKSTIDEMAVADVEGFALITLTGDDGSKVVVAPRTIISAENPEARWGHIPAGNIEGLSKLVDGWIRRAAQLSRTPLNYFQITGQVASKETQQADEAVLVSMVESASTDIGNSWENAMMMARRIYNTFGAGGLDEAENISTLWGPFERVDALGREQLRANIVKTLTDSGASLQGALKAADYDDDMIEVLIRGDYVDGMEQ